MKCASGFTMEIQSRTLKLSSEVRTFNTAFKTIVMNTKLTIGLLIVLFQNGVSQSLKKAEDVLVNGNTVHYEVYGSGKPLFLLHGYALSAKSWMPFVDQYTHDYAVYLVDLQGHGKSS